MLCYVNYAAFDVLLMTTPSLHSFMRSSQAESIIAAVSGLALRRRRLTSCNVSSTRHQESLEHAQVRPGTHSFPAKSGRCRPGSVQSLCPGIQMFAQDGSWIPVDLLPIRLRHFWSSPPAISWPWSSRLPMCETCFVRRRTFICIRRPFKLELTSCSP